VYTESVVAAEDIIPAVEVALLAREPLGAYADANRLHYLFAGPQGVLDLVAARPPAGVAVAALAGVYPMFDWDEREMRDAQGVALAGHPDERPLFIAGAHVPPALTAEGGGVTVVSVGPVHAGIIEPGRFTFSTGGETVIHLDAQLSYSRRGVEASLHGGLAVEQAGRVGRICAACSAARSWAYARALEHLGDVRCDERSELARVVVAELERIYNHLFDLASAASGAGFGYGLTHGLGLKERAHELCSSATQHRLLFDAIVPGGVRAGVLLDAPAVRTGAAWLHDDARAFVRALFGNISVVRRFEGAGVVSAAVARAFGAVGPARRASGGTVDIRSTLPYGAYCDLQPVVETETDGDVAARIRVKARELDIAFELVDRALAALGEHAPPPPQRVAPDAGTVTMLTEGPRGTESVSLACSAQGVLESIHVLSASYRNWPVVLRAMEGNIVPDFPLVNKSFNLCYACVDR
jgi:Ni,Fe-hydrogenase III large subunit